MTANSDWLARYQARKTGQQPPPQYAQQPVYQPPPPPPGYQPGYQPPPPPPPQTYGPQPLPGAPAHAPFGYDQATGVPLAPYGRDQYGNVVVQPYPQQWQQPAQWPQQQPQQPMHDARGQVMPQGYGQPPYGPPVPQGPAVEYDPNTGQQVVHAMDAAAYYRGGKGQMAQPCPECDGFLIPTDATPEARKLNIRTGEFAYPAGHCNKCGFNGVMTPGDGVASIAGLAGGSINIVGQPRPAPGGGSLIQTAGQHGMPNLFAPKTA